MTASIRATPDPRRPVNVDLQPAWAQPIMRFLQDAAEHGYSVELTAKPDTLTPAEMAALLGISRATISRRIRAGEIRSIKVGNRHRIPLAEVEAYRDAMMASIANMSQDDIEAELVRD